MQERLDRWKANVLPVKSASILKRKSPGNFVPRRRDHSDDIREFESKQHNQKAKDESKSS